MRMNRMSDRRCRSMLALQNLAPRDGRGVKQHEGLTMHHREETDGDIGCRDATGATS